MSEPKKLTPEEVWDALDNLRRSLNEAYWQIADQKEADFVLATAQDIDAIQDQITREEFAVGTDQYKQLAAHVKVVNQRLDKLKVDLDKFVHRVETVTKVVGYLDKAVALAAKYFV